MNHKTLKDSAHNLESLDAGTVQDLIEMTKRFPYFAWPFVLLAKQYQQKQDFRAEALMHQAALRVHDRSWLYTFSHASNKTSEERNTQPSESKIEPQVSIEAKTPVPVDEPPLLIDVQIPAVVVEPPLLIEVQIPAPIAEPPILVETQVPIVAIPEATIPELPILVETQIIDPVAEPKELITSQIPAPVVEPKELITSQIPAPVVEPQELIEAHIPAPIAEPKELIEAQIPAPVVEPPLLTEVQIPAPVIEPKEFTAADVHTSNTILPESSPFVSNPKRNQTGNERRPLFIPDRGQVYDLERIFNEKQPIEQAPHAGKASTDFYAWLNTAPAKTTLPDSISIEPIQVPLPEIPESIAQQKSIIENFLINKPSISRPKQEFFKPEKAQKKGEILSGAIVTETLAQIYLKQDNPQKAIWAYQQLQLKFPEKKTYFASLISQIEIEQNKS